MLAFCEVRHEIVFVFLVQRRDMNIAVDMMVWYFDVRLLIIALVSINDITVILVLLVLTLGIFNHQEIVD